METTDARALLDHPAPPHTQRYRECLLIDVNVLDDMIGE